MPSSVHLLDVDPDLAEHLSAEERAQAHELVRLDVLHVPKGRWQPPLVERGATGLLVMAGLLAGSLRLGPVSSTELVGPGDIIRPWEEDLLPSLSPALTEWRALGEVRVAIIDRRATAALGRFPELSAAVASRLVRRARCLSYLMAAQHFLRVEDRLVATLWHLAGLWGRVTPQGTVVPFHLTHDMLAGIIGAQRPTTTTALRSLADQGRIVRDERRYFVLCGDPPDWDRIRVPSLPVEV
jgi:CRP/FNR family transcriptional regulator, cyclic AMP receptor protein